MVGGAHQRKLPSLFFFFFLCCRKKVPSSGSHSGRPTSHPLASLRPDTVNNSVSFSCVTSGPHLQTHNEPRLSSHELHPYLANPWAIKFQKWDTTFMVYGFTHPGMTHKSLREHLASHSLWLRPFEEWKQKFCFNSQGLIFKSTREPRCPLTAKWCNALICNEIPFQLKIVVNS